MPQEQFPLGFVSLQSCEGALEDQETKKGCFMLVTQSRTYKFVAGNKNEMTEWINSIKTAIPIKEKPKPLTSSPSASDGMAGLKLANDFFTQEERTSPHEVEAVMLDLIFAALEKRFLLPALFY